MALVTLEILDQIRMVPQVVTGAPAATIATVALVVTAMDLGTTTTSDPGGIAGIHTALEGEVEATITVMDPGEIAGIRTALEGEVGATITVMARGATITVTVLEAEEVVTPTVQGVIHTDLTCVLVKHNIDVSGL